MEARIIGGRSHPPASRPSLEHTSFRTRPAPPHLGGQYQPPARSVFRHRRRICRTRGPAYRRARLRRRRARSRRRRRGPSGCGDCRRLERRVSEDARISAGRADRPDRLRRDACARASAPRRREGRARPHGNTPTKCGVPRPPTHSTSRSLPINRRRTRRASCSICAIAASTWWSAGTRHRSRRECRHGGGIFVFARVGARGLRHRARSRAGHAPRNDPASTARQSAAASARRRRRARRARPRRSDEPAPRRRARPRRGECRRPRAARTRARSRRQPAGRGRRHVMHGTWRELCRASRAACQQQRGGGHRADVSGIAGGRTARPDAAFTPARAAVQRALPARRYRSARPNRSNGCARSCGATRDRTPPC